jgi:serine/threonine protein kinase
MTGEPLSEISALPPSVALRIDEACLRFEAALKAAAEGGPCPKCDDFLADMPDPGRSLLRQELEALERAYRGPASQRHTEEPPGSTPSVPMPGADGLPVTQDIPPATSASSGARRGSPDPADTPDLPAFIGKYRIVEWLGHGGQGDVFRAVHPHLPGRDVVIKWMHGDLSQARRQQLLDEGGVLAQLNEPGVVQVYDVDIHDGRPFLVLEHVAGQSLHQQLKQHRPPVREAVRLVADLAGILARVHRQGVLHGDLKPGNVLIDATGRPRLIDFGLAWRQEWGSGSESTESAVCGTFAYMAPEQANGQADRIGPRTDVFGLGTVLYELLTGRPPYQGPNRTAIWGQAKEGRITPPRQVNPLVPRSLERVCVKALATEPDQRYSTATEMERALRRSLGRRRLSLLLLAVAGVPVLVALLLAWTGWVPPRPAAGQVAAVRPLKGSIDVCISDPNDPARRDLFLDDPGALPLRPADEFHIVAELNRPAYAYVLWIDTDGQLLPVYPWRPGHWEEWPDAEERVERLRRPEDIQRDYKLPRGMPGMHTLVLLARDERLPRDVNLRAELGALAQPRAQDMRATVWFENGVPVRNKRGRGGFFDETQHDDPVLVTQERIRERLLGRHFTYVLAVSFANRGK